jgi:3'(2'), 5'-bisphosphate nucleotidase
LNNFPKEYLIAIEASIKASETLMLFYSEDFTTEIKNDGSPVTEADLASSKVIIEILTSTEIPILGEESFKEEYSKRKDWNLNWCVDPLDGTKEFIKKNGEFAVCIALIENQIPIYGVIAWPTEGKVIFGNKDLGVYISDFDSINNSKKWVLLSQPKEVNNPLVVVGSRSFANNDFDQLVNKLNKHYPELEYFQKGSALKFFDLAMGKADIYPRFAPTMEWDIAAGHAILNGLGGEIFDIDTKQPLKYNKENLRNPYFIAKTYPVILD